MEIISSSGTRRTAYGWASGDNPGHPDFHHEVPAEVAGVIARCVSGLNPSLGEITGIRALQPCEHVVGRYHLITDRGEWFVRVSSLKGHPDLEREITQYLSDAGVSVASLIFSGQTFLWNGSEYRMDIRAFLYCRHFDGSDADLARTARVLKECHQALKSFPAAEKVRALAAERYAKLAAARDRLVRLLKEERFEEISPYGEWTLGQAYWLQELAAGFQPAYDVLPDAQCLHSQPHRANIVYRLDNDAPVLLDFEDAVAVYAPVSWDLAYFIQRFCLHGAPNEAETCRRFEIVAQNYGHFGGEVFEMMRQISWLSIVILVDAWITNQVEAPLAEYEKFVGLEQQARAAKALWEQPR